MKIKSYQTAFHRDGEVRVREIQVPDDEIEFFEGRPLSESILSRVFYYGQNEFQPVEGCYSLSVGDVVELPDGRMFRCCPFGWDELGPDENPTALTGQAASRAAYGV